MTPKRTALFEEHQKLGAKLIDFGGWEMPVQYPTGVIAEHRACREAAALFDVSHMGEVLVEGPGAVDFLNLLVTNDVSKVAVGQAQYTAMCNPQGGIVDDLVLYRRAPEGPNERFLVVVNASNTAKDFAWMQEVKENLAQGRAREARLTDASPRYSQIAIQGPKAPEILQKLTATPLSPIAHYHFAEGQILDRVPAVIARTGYTGEDGFEIYVPWDQGPALWRALLAAGEPLGLKPAGLAARDTLRLEMKYALYGNELSDDTTPLETGLGWVTKLGKTSNFIGRDALMRVKQSGIPHALVGLKILDRGIARHGYPVFDAKGERRLGVVTSGTQSPTLGYPIAIALLEAPHSSIGTRVTVDVRGNRLAAEIVPTPFVKKSAR